MTCKTCAAAALVAKAMAARLAVARSRVRAVSRKTPRPEVQGGGGSMAGRSKGETEIKFINFFHDELILIFMS